MFTMTRAMEEALFQHFMHQKLRIAYAIHKPFPFFEGLLDNSIITKTMYMESLEACRNLVPVSRVAHNILTQLERTFNLSLLATLFSQINLHEYPNLVTIYRSFKRVGASYEQQSRDTPILLEAPTGLAEGSSLHTPLALPPPQPPQPSSSPGAPRVSEPGTSSQQSDEILSESPSPSDPVLPLPGLVQEGRSTPVTNDELTSKMNEEDDSEEMPSLLASTVPVASDSLISQIKDKEDPQEMSHSPLGSMPEIRDDSPEPNDPEKPQEVSSTPSYKKGKKRKRYVWSTPKRRHKKKSLPRDAASPRHGIQKKLKVVDQVPQKKDDSTWNSTVVTRVQKARAECARNSRSEEITDDTSKMNEGKRSQRTPSTPSRVTQEERRKEYGQSSSKRKQKKKHPRVATSPGHGIKEKLQVVDKVTGRMDDSTWNSKVMMSVQKARTECAQKSRSKGKPKSDTVDFHCSKLPVTCGEAKGILYKKKMKHGSSVKCIQNEDGTWLTLKEFEMEGKGRNTKNWNRSIRCGGTTLGELLKNGLLLCPPRKNLKRQLNSK